MLAPSGAGLTLGDVRGLIVQIKQVVGCKLSKTTAARRTAKLDRPPAVASTARGRARPAPRARRHYLPAEERRARILDAAREVFARCGLQGSRTRDLAKAAGINQATLFEHFESKEDLFAAAVLQPLHALLEGVRERYAAYEAADSPHSLLKLLQSGMQKHLLSMVEIYPLLIRALFADEASGKKLYHEKIQPLIETRAGYVRKVVKNSLDAKVVELATFGMFFAIIMDRVMTGNSDDLSEVSGQLAELVMFGCARHLRDDHMEKSRA
jgi:TetR/AcrR family transcriptional regulator